MLLLLQIYKAAFYVHIILYSAKRQKSIVNYLAFNKPQKEVGNTIRAQAYYSGAQPMLK